MRAVRRDQQVKRAEGLELRLPRRVAVQREQTRVHAHHAAHGMVDGMHVEDLPLPIRGTAVALEHRDAQRAPARGSCVGVAASGCERRGSELVQHIGDDGRVAPGGRCALLVETLVFARPGTLHPRRVVAKVGGAGGSDGEALRTDDGVIAAGQRHPIRKGMHASAS